MNTHTEKTKDDNSKLVDQKVSQKQGSGESTFQFVDNRPEAIVQRKLQETANNSTQVKQAGRLQSITENHSAQQQQPIQKKENNTGLPDNLKTGIENISGYSMDDVKVHRNSDKPAQLQAHAYAQGTDIHLGPGQEKHLPHEAWHVVQQKQGRVKPTMQMKGKINVNDDAGLEKEADVMGVKALQFVQSNKTEVSKSSNPEHNQSVQLQTKTDSAFGVEALKSSAEEADQDKTNKNEEFYLASFIQKLSVYSISDIEGISEVLDSEESISDTDFDEDKDKEEQPFEKNGASENIQLAVNDNVVQKARLGNSRKNGNINYYINKLAKSYRLLIEAKKFISEGEIRNIKFKEFDMIEEGLRKTIYYFRKFSESKKKNIDFQLEKVITKLMFMNNRLTRRIVYEGRTREARKTDQFLSNTDSVGVDRNAVKIWYSEIKNRNKRILEIIVKDSFDVTQHPWFMMDYEDIIDSQADEADSAIAIGISNLMNINEGNIPNVCRDIFLYISESDHYLPLVNFQRAEPNNFGNQAVIRVDYSINPSYKKFIDPTKTGDGSEAIQILGDATDTTVKTDIRFIPGSLTVGDQTSQVGKQMEAVTLSKDHPTGSIAGKDTSQKDLMENLQKQMGDKKTKYVKGHLLNDHIGGPARPYNLFPISEQANNDHLVFMEKYVKAEVAKGYVMYYKVIIDPKPVVDKVSTKTNHLRRYTIDSDIKCWSAKIDKTGNQIEKRNITVKSVWNGGEVLDEYGVRIRRGSDTSTTGNAIGTHLDYTSKLKSGVPNEAGTNPDVKAPDSSIHKIYNKSGYNQDNMHKGKLSDSDFSSTTSGAIPFSISGTKGNLSTATQASVATIAGKHIAGLIWGSTFITSGKLKVGILESELNSIKGVGPVTINKLKSNFIIL